MPSEFNYFPNPYRERPRFWREVCFTIGWSDVKGEVGLKRKLAAALYWFIFMPGYSWYQYWAKYQNHLDYLRERTKATRSMSKFRRWNRNYIA